MFDPTILEPRQMTMSEFAEIERQIRSEHKSISDVERTWHFLNQYFLDESPEYDRMYMWTFFRLYTDISWKLLHQQYEEYVRDVMIPRMIPMACMRGIEVVTQIAWYIRTKGVVESDVETLFLDMKNAFLASQSIIGIEGTRKKTMQSLIAEASVIEQTHANTIAISEFYAKMEGVLLPVVEKEGWEQTIAISPEEIVRHIMEVISFFRAGKKENIWYLIDSIIYPEVELIEQEYGDQAKEQESSDQTALSAPPIGKEPTQPSLQTIITTAKNMDVNNPEAILSYLDEQATALGDDQIRDLYYYDEQTGVFAWNTDVLSNGNNG